jgi:hypothetical protein
VSNRTKLRLSPAWAARLAANGLSPADIGRIVNRAAPAPAVPDDIPVPRNDSELAEFFGDPGRYSGILASKEALQTFIRNYAEQQQAPGTELHRLVEIETQRVLTAMLKDNGADTDGIKRLNLDPQTRPPSMLTSHKQATAYNAKAAGAVLDNEFATAGEFIHQTWHLNASPEAAAKIARLRNAYSSVVPSDGGFLVPETLA